MCATTREGLERAEQCFFKRCPEEVRIDLSKTGEPVATYFDAGALRQTWIDFLAIGATADRLRFGRELFFPPAAYMLSRYPETQHGVAAVALRAPGNGRSVESPST